MGESEHWKELLSPLPDVDTDTEQMEGQDLARRWMLDDPQHQGITPRASIDANPDSRATLARLVRSYYQGDGPKMMKLYTNADRYK